MPKRHVARVLLSVVVVGVAVPFAGWTVYSIKPTWSLQYAEASAAESVGPQISNTNGKSDRLALAETAVPAAKPVSTFRLASAEPATTPVTLPPRVTPPVIEATSAPAFAPVAADPVAAAPLPHQKPKRAEPPSNMLDESQITSIRNRLRLTSDQMEYWPAVEMALRGVGRYQTREARKRIDGKAPIDVNSPEVQKLVWAAMPLLGLLREDQKREVRSLVRIIGLEKVASQI